MKGGRPPSSSPVHPIDDRSPKPLDGTSIWVRRAAADHPAMSEPDLLTEFVLPPWHRAGGAARCVGCPRRAAGAGHGRGQARARDPELRTHHAVPADHVTQGQPPRRVGRIASESWSWPCSGFPMHFSFLSPIGRTLCCVAVLRLPLSFSTDASAVLEVRADQLTGCARTTYRVESGSGLLCPRLG